MYSRKAAYHYGWDWGPRIVTSGIWKPIKLEGYDIAAITDMRVLQISVDEKQAHMDAVIEFNFVGVNQEFELVVSMDMGEVLGKQNIVPEKSQYKVYMPFIIKDPKLWWTRNLGTPYMYRINVDLY